MGLTMKKKQLNLRCLVKNGLFCLSMISTTQAMATDKDKPSDFQVSEPFLVADENQDGKISHAEYLNLMKANVLMEAELTYKRMDSDGSGMVKPRELQQFLATTNIGSVSTSNVILLNSALKASGDDGQLSLQEFTSMRLVENAKYTNYLWKFSRLDTNHDQQLTLEEFFNLDNYILPPELQIIAAEPGSTSPSNLEEPEAPPFFIDTDDLEETDFPSDSEPEPQLDHDLNT